MSPKKIRIYYSLTILFVSLVTYLTTVAPTVSFWDCGEFIAAANILGIPHPPGTPLFTLMARSFIILLSFFTDVAFRVNLISAVSSAFAVMFLFLFTEKLLGHILRTQVPNLLTLSGGLVAALLLNFSDTFWFNAVEAEVYSTSMMIVILISWLSVLWVDERDKPQGSRYLLMICYLAFLGIGFHLYTVMTLPGIIVLMMMVDKKYRKDYPLILTGVLLLSIIYMTGKFLTIAIVTLAVWAAASFMVQNQELRNRFRLCAWFCALAIVGFSTYASIPIRSALNPRIDENNPEIRDVFDNKSWDKFRGYIERKQYGSESMLKRAMHRRGAIGNQLFSHPHMGYGGYMLAQYFPWKVGEGNSQIVDKRYKGTPQFSLGEYDPVERLGHTFRTQMEIMPPYSSKGRLLQIAFFLLFHVVMLYGGVRAYKTNKPFGTYILLLYTLSSIGLVFYMNFSDGIRPDLAPYQQWIQAGADPGNPPENVYMEVRERDYFYVPAFIFMSVLFGLSAAFYLQKLSLKKGLKKTKPMAAILVAVAFIVPCFSNYHEHNRSGIFVPYDYARNLLESCRPNSVLFTNGDNDTFPLWFMQEAVGFRKDVRVVNLSLANTEWYLHQILDVEPTLKLGFDRVEIDNLRPQLNPSENPVDFGLGKSGISVSLPGRKDKPYYTVQDYIVLNIVKNNYPDRPIHFAVTVSTPNMMGLEKYMTMEGMVFTLTNQVRNQDLNVERTKFLVDSVYWYRGLKGGTSYLNGDTKGLLSNYFSTNHRLIRWAQSQVEELRAKKAAMVADTTGEAPDSLEPQTREIDKEIEERMAMGEKYIQLTTDLLPWDWRHYYLSSEYYEKIGQPEKAEAMAKKGIQLKKRDDAFGAQLAQIYSGQNNFPRAESVYSSLLERFPEDFNMIYAMGEIQEKQGKFAEAKTRLADWLDRNPEHQYAPYISKKIQDLDRQQQVKNAQSAEELSSPVDTADKEPEEP